MTLPSNLILDTDSYKASHANQYPPDMQGMFSYLESRGGVYPATVFFGLQYLLNKLATPLDELMVYEAEHFFAAHGEPFPEKAWFKVVKEHKGLLPIRIRAVPEGSLVPVSNILMSVESVTADPELAWLPSWVETMFMRLWYPTTVATQSFYAKKTILEHLQRSAEDPWAEIDFKLHDFGARGVSSLESAGIGGAAHLVNFKGSDTVEGIRFANHYYHSPMSGFSIPATEHSTITSWGRDHEHEAYANLVKCFCKPGATVACVSDSYDLWNVLENVWGGSLHEAVKNSGATIVIRPDSGDPAEIVLQTLDMLRRKVGMSLNTKGYLVLPKYYRIIQGDGVNPKSIDEILKKIQAHGYSASNVAFGMGGVNLQQVNRDTQKFAYKCSAAFMADGTVRDVYKDPVTDHGKMSKRGLLDLIQVRDAVIRTSEVEVPVRLVDAAGTYQTIKRTDVTSEFSAMRTVYEPGHIHLIEKLDDIRARANLALKRELEREEASGPFVITKKE